MKYRWQITPQITQFLIKLEAQKISLENINQLPHIELAIRTRSILRSAVYSAKIEGFLDEESSPKKESQNLLLAYNKIHSNSPKDLSLSKIKGLHKIVMSGLSANAGVFRSEPWAIFDGNGNAVYLAPMHFEIPKLMGEYLEDIHDTKDHPAVIAAVAQFIFEKIHPFADGNGRVGRLISAYILIRYGYGFRGLIPFEKYIESHRALYYEVLESSHEITEFIQFFLEALTSEVDEIISSLNNREEKREDLLLPRRKEILNIISDHPFCTFDQIRRRFMLVNEKTLKYDISQLLKKGYIDKVGATRGALYKKSV